MRIAFRPLMGFAVGYVVAFACGLGITYGLLGVLIPATLTAVVFAKLQTNFTAKAVKTGPGYFLLALGRLIGGSAVGLFLVMLAGMLFVRWLDPACAVSRCDVPGVFGFVGLIGGAILGLLYFRWKTARTLAAKSAA